MRTVPIGYKPRSAFSRTLINSVHSGPQKRRFSCSRLRPNSQRTIRSRFERFNTRMPRFLQRYTTPLLNAPVSHISAFLILHEVTAVVPLFGFAGVFHYTQWLPPFIYEWRWVAEGVEKLSRYAKRKGWLGQEDEAEIAQMEHKGEWTEEWRQKRDPYWKWGEGGTRLLVEFATAYAITKALLPLRIVFSVWATPWFATTFFQPFIRWIPRRTRASITASPAAGTNAIGGGVNVPKVGK